MLLVPRPHALIYAKAVALDYLGAAALIRRGKGGELPSMIITYLSMVCIASVWSESPRGQCLPVELPVLGQAQARALAAAQWALVRGATEWPVRLGSGAVVLGITGNSTVAPTGPRRSALPRCRLTAGCPRRGPHHWPGATFSQRAISEPPGVRAIKVELLGCSLARVGQGYLDLVPLQPSHDHDEVPGRWCRRRPGGR